MLGSKFEQQSEGVSIAGNCVRALAAIRPAPGRWSVVQCVEHVAVSEDFLLSRIIQAQSSGAPVVNQKREAAILARGADRATPVISPEVGRPMGRFATLADAVGSFLATCEQTVRFVEACGEDLRARPMTHRSELQSL